VSVAALVRAVKCYAAVLEINSYVASDVYLLCV